MSLWKMYVKNRHKGHIVSDEGIRCDPDKLSRIEKWPVPRYSGIIFIIKFSSKIASPLFDLTKRIGNFIWIFCQTADDTLKNSLTHSVVLRYHDFSNLSF